jgi:biopolymer transport protein ExbB/TolQ
MSSKPAAQVSSVNTNLQRAFENAVRDIHEAEGKGANHRMPIVQRARVTRESAGNVQEKALADAAKALAQLWKVSPNSSR